MNKEQELRPCPWCNGAAQPPIYSLGRWFCRCTKCGTSGPSFSHGGPHAGEAEISAAKDQAIAAWNRRSSDEQAEVVAVAWEGIQPDGITSDITRKRAKAEMWEHNGWIVRPLYVSPPAVAAGGVTEAQVEAAMSAYWGFNPVTSRTARDRMVEALTAALAVRDEGILEGWQPIETAPKDGREVLLWLGSPWSKVEKARWYAPWNNWQTGVIPSDPAREELHGIGSAAPTHWQPLPTPPSRGEGV